MVDNNKWFKLLHEYLNKRDNDPNFFIVVLLI